MLITNHSANDLKRHKMLRQEKLLNIIFCIFPGTLLAIVIPIAVVVLIAIIGIIICLCRERLQKSFSPSMVSTIDFTAIDKWQ